MVTLSKCQQKARTAFSDFLSKKNDTFFILTGGPGRGKSFITKILLEDATNILRDMQVIATATTNKAAKVLGDAIGQEAITIHSLLGLRIVNNTSRGTQDLRKTPSSKVITDALIVIDEISMLDDALMTYIRELTHNCIFLLVGDKDQLASITALNPPVFRKGYTTVELVEPMRYDKDSGIANLAEQMKSTINTGVFMPIIPNDVDIIQLSGEEFQSGVNTAFTEDMPLDSRKIICWTNDKVKAYNEYIRKRHYKSDHFVVGEQVVTNHPILSGQEVIYPTDSVMTITKVSTPDERYGVKGYWYTLPIGGEVFCASEQADVTNLLKQLAASAKRGGSWLEYFNTKEFFVDLRATHACTAYKSQGSTYNEAYIDLADIGKCKSWQQVARMLYVACTRPQRRIYLYGTLPPKYQQHAYTLN